MNNKEYLTEEKYEKMNKTFKTLYLTLLIIGIILFIVGIILLVLNKDSNIINIIVGLCLIIFGIGLSALSIRDFIRHAYTRDIISYYQQQQMPIAKESIEKMAPSVGVAAKEISKGVKDGLKEEK